MAEESVAEARISLAFLKLLDLKPFSRISISEITEKAGVSRVSYYRHFSSKEDILTKHCDYVLESIIRDLRSRKISNGYDFWRCIYSNLGETNLAYHMIRSGLEDEFFDILEAKMSVIFSEILKVDISDKINLVLMEFVIGGIVALLRKPMLINRKITDEDVASFILRLSEHGRFVKI